MHSVDPVTRVTPPTKVLLLAPQRYIPSFPSKATPTPLPLGGPMSDSAILMSPVQVLKDNPSALLSGLAIQIAALQLSSAEPHFRKTIASF